MIDFTLEELEKLANDYDKAEQTPENINLLYKIRYNILDYKDLISEHDCCEQSDVHYICA